MTRSRLLPAALAAVLVLGACGSDESSTVPVPGVSVDGTGLRAPEPIELAAGSNVGALAGAESDAVSVDEGMRALPFWDVDYEVDDDMPALPADDLGWVYDASTSVDEATVRDLAETFGLDDDPVALDPELGGGWRVGPEDGSEPVLWVGDDAQLWWNYSAAYEASTGVGCVEPGEVTIDPEVVDPELTVDDVPVEVTVDDAAVSDPSGTTDGAGEPDATAPNGLVAPAAVDETLDDHCADPVPAPDGVPSEGEAEALVLDFLDELGVDTTGMTVQTYSDEWFASVDVFETGDTPGRSWNFGFGGDAELQYAGGTLATPERAGPYDLIGLDEAIDRLENPSGPWGGSWARYDAAVDLPLVEPAVAEAPPEDMVVSSEPMPSEPMPVDSVPVDPAPTAAEPVVVTLVDVEADVWWAWDVDGSAWVLPAYRFIDTDGGWHVVPAVADQYLVGVGDDVVLPTEPVEEPPAETAPPGPAVGASVDGSWVGDAAIRPDLLTVEPPIVGPGGEVAVTFAEDHPRGIAWAIQTETAAGWADLYWMTAGSTDSGLRGDWVAAHTEDWDVVDLGVSGVGPDVVPVPDTIETGEYRLCTANAAENVCIGLAIADLDDVIVEPKPDPAQPTEPTESAPPIDDVVEVVGVYEGVAFYPACGNESLTLDGVTWYQVSEDDFPVEYERVMATEREDPPATSAVRGLVRVVEPGPGDDVGTLVVWADGVARFTSDSGDLTAWLIDDELTYDWAC